MDDTVKYLTDEQFKDYLTVRLYENLATPGSHIDGKMRMQRAVDLYKYMKELQRDQVNGLR